MKKILICLCIISITFTLTACHSTLETVHRNIFETAYELLKEEFPYFFCELMPPSPL